MIKIYTANTAFEADQIQALLKSYDIPCIIKNEVSTKKRLFARILIIAIIAVDVAVVLLGEIL